MSDKDIVMEVAEGEAGAPRPAASSNTKSPILNTTSGFTPANAASSANTSSESTNTKSANAAPKSSDAQLSPSAESPAQPPKTMTDASLQQNSVPKDGASAGPSPYGTRSRNRTGGARINYAEDKDVDMEYDYNGPAAGAQSGRTAISSGNVSRDSPSGDARSSTASSNKKTGNNNTGGFVAVNAGSIASLPKDAIPGTSTFSANSSSSAATTSKKRKAPGTHASTSTTTTNAQPTSQSVTRKSAGVISTNTNRETNMLTFHKSRSVLDDGRLIADDGTVLRTDDHVYLVCEPPGDPYYLCRIMEFIHAESDNKASPVESIRVNWFYRPRDVLRYNNDTRLVYATMHSDICPLTSLRGKCKILHRSEISDLDDYRKGKDCFWYNQAFDRFIHRWYEVIPVGQIINVPEKVKKALDERWKYVVVEVGRVKELTSAVKTCKRCVGYCATNDSVECAVCHNAYHMNCVRPPLLKKPSRGFAWACGPCSRAQERKLEARHTPIIGDVPEEEEEEFVDEEEDAGALLSTTAPTPQSSNDLELQPTSMAEVAAANMWPMRYLGIHCRVEDALQYDDRAIYPRASSRLGNRHQAFVQEWFGRPVELVKPLDIKKKYIKSGSHKKDSKLSKDTLAAIEADKVARANRPKWVQDEPPGYVARGEDYPNDDPRNSAQLLYRPAPEVYDKDPVDVYMDRVKELAKPVFDLKKFNTNLLTKAMELYTKYDGNADRALEALRKLDKKKDLKEPVLTKEEMKRFDEGVAKYGSEHRNIRLHVKTVSHADIVRYYYMWKKTPKGKEIWGSYDGRKGTKKKAEAAENAGSKLQDDIADDQDDSAFDNSKAVEKRRSFQCKFCLTRKSRQWRRAPGVAPGTTVSADGKLKDKGSQYVLALCQRCAGLWRKYAIKWENMEEVAKKIAQGGGRAWKRRIDEELLAELVSANESVSAAEAPSGNATPSDPSSMTPQPSAEPPKKKQKNVPDKDTPIPSKEAAPKKKVVAPPALPPPPKLPTPPPQPDPPRLKQLPCSVCNESEGAEDQLLVCKDCRLTVHRNCYGVFEHRNLAKWVCDMCLNDRNPQYSMIYECVLCSITYTPCDMYEAPKVSHKKKTDREREKERLEKELTQLEINRYRQQQIERNRPTEPREALKRTANNNWMHVTCAVWMPEVRFSNAKALAASENFGIIPQTRFEQVCKICKIEKGACTSCHQCHAQFHVACAKEAGYHLGFDITPVKGSRRDLVSVVTLGDETGTMSAAIWCREHTVKTILHRPNEPVPDSPLNALQLYVQNFKQADLTLTGTVRKANLMNQFNKTISQNTTLPVLGNRRVSTTNVPTPASARATRNSLAGPQRVEELDGDISPTDQTKPVIGQLTRRCYTCNIDVSPKWWKMESDAARDMALLSAPRSRSMTNGTHTDEQRPCINGHVPTGADARQNGVSIDASPAERWQCHKCHFRAIHEPPPPPPPPPPAPKEESAPPEPERPLPVLPPAPPPANRPPSPSPPRPSFIDSWARPQANGPSLGPSWSWGRPPAASPPIVPPHSLPAHAQQVPLVGHVPNTLPPMNPGHQAPVHPFHAPPPPAGPPVHAFHHPAQHAPPQHPHGPSTASAPSYFAHHSPPPPPHYASPRQPQQPLPHHVHPQHAPHMPPMAPPPYTPPAMAPHASPSLGHPSPNLTFPPPAPRPTPPRDMTHMIHQPPPAIPPPHAAPEPRPSTVPSGASSSPSLKNLIS